MGGFGHRWKVYAEYIAKRSRDLWGAEVFGSFFLRFLVGTDARLEVGRYKCTGNRSLLNLAGSTGAKVARYKLSVAERFPSSFAGF
jgi:hypothetical protein